MWTRANLKANAKVAFKRNYWKCVLVAFILGIVANSGSSSVSTSVGQNTNTIISEDFSNNDFENEYFEEEHHEENSIIGNIGDIFASGVSGVVATIGIAIVLIVLICATILSVFVFGPLEVGCRNYFKINAFEQAELDALTIGFKKNNYMRMVGTIFFRNLYTLLWTFLFIIPGIIKSYEYRMIPYILTDCPDIPRQEAFRISKEMMRGNKMEAFILDISFIGWSLLAVITCGIAGVFYVNPYIAATDAELFIAIREEYFRNQREAHNESNTNNSWEN